MKKYKISFIILASVSFILLLNSVLAFMNKDIDGVVKSLAVSIISAIMSVLYYKSIKIQP